MYLFLGGDHINKNTKKTILAMLSISLISSYIIIEKGVFALNLGIFTKLERKENEFKNLETEIQETVDKLNVVGLSISVIENNKISYSQGFGYADIDKKHKNRYKYNI